MPYAINDGVRIHFEAVGSGPPLVLQHGFTLAPSQWRHMGFVEPLMADFRLILISARGHGESDRPHAPSAYTNALMASDVVAVLDELEIEKAHFCGFSMGGRIGFNVAGHYPNRLLSLAAGGATPGTAADLDRPSDIAAEIEHLRQGTAALLGSMESGGWQLPGWFRESVLSNDPEALIAYLKARTADRDATPLLLRMTMPILIFCGERDEAHEYAQAAAELIPSATFTSIPGHGHIIPPETWLPILQDFLRTVPA